MRNRLTKRKEEGLRMDSIPVDGDIHLMGRKDIFPEIGKENENDVNPGENETYEPGTRKFMLQSGWVREYYLIRQ